ncbi:hypothetical protein HYH03_009484 [Edaphochlamys debaryana]|uniref:Uncharacterized protein n=1 Tax=Edaphochlamys debaryana TaxID=47281 RepID=A0A835XYH5_9CHLO|nr:hypothetical protein HYH03_009484 [Edaphochlamys debaryana]|eukprot:KAG2492240.1 hypothetical protein HYH03_009484 [Edaphochlamys debaryana]
MRVFGGTTSVELVPRHVLRSAAAGWELLKRALAEQGSQQPTWKDLLELTTGAVVSDSLRSAPSPLTEYLTALETAARDPHSAVPADLKALLGVDAADGAALAAAAGAAAHQAGTQGASSPIDAIAASLDGVAGSRFNVVYLCPDEAGLQLRVQIRYGADDGAAVAASLAGCSRRVQQLDAARTVVLLRADGRLSAVLLRERKTLRLLFDGGQASCTADGGDGGRLPPMEQGVVHMATDELPKDSVEEVALQQLLHSPLPLCTWDPNVSWSSTRQADFDHPQTLYRWEAVGDKPLGEVIREHQRKCPFKPMPGLMVPLYVEAQELDSEQEVVAQLGPAISLLEKLAKRGAVQGGLLFQTARWRRGPPATIFKAVLAFWRTVGDLLEAPAESGAASLAASDGEVSVSSAYSASHDERVAPELVLVVQEQRQRQAGSGGEVQGEAASEAAAAAAAAGRATAVGGRLRAVCVGEVKYPAGLTFEGEPVDLKDAYDNRGHPRHRQAREVIGQVFTHLRGLRACHGFISSSWNASWLVHVPWEDRSRMFVSAPFPADRGHDTSDCATMLGALSWVQYDALSWVQYDALEFAASGVFVPHGPRMAWGVPGAAPPGLGEHTPDGHQRPGGGGEGGTGPGSRRPGCACAGGASAPSGSEPLPAGASGEQRRCGTAVPETSRPPSGSGPAAATDAPTALAPGTPSSQTPEAAHPWAGGTVELDLGEALDFGHDGVLFWGQCGGCPAVIKVFTWGRHAAYQREAQAYERLRSLHGSVLPRVLAAGRLPGGLRFIALQPLHDQPLSRLPRPLAPAVQAAALAALRAAQDAHPGFVHGDVRPANFMWVAPAEGGAGAEAAGAEGAGGEGAGAAQGGSGGAAGGGGPRCVLLD